MSKKAGRAIGSTTGESRIHAPPFGVEDKRRNAPAGERGFALATRETSALVCPVFHAQRWGSSPSRKKSRLAHRRIGSSASSPTPNAFRAFFRARSAQPSRAVAVVISVPARRWISPCISSGLLSAPNSPSWLGKRTVTSVTSGGRARSTPGNTTFGSNPSRRRAAASFTASSTVRRGASSERPSTSSGSAG